MTDQRAEQMEIDHEALGRTLTKMLGSARDEQWSDNRCMLAADRLAGRVANSEFGLVPEDGITHTNGESTIDVLHRLALVVGVVERWSRTDCAPTEPEAIQLLGEVKEMLAVRDAEMEQLRAEAKSHSNSWAHCDERRQALYQENERLRAELAGLRERAVASGGPTVWLLDGGPGIASRHYRETNGLLETREPLSKNPWRLSLYSSLAEVRRKVGPLTEVTEPPGGDYV